MAVKVNHKDDCRDVELDSVGPGGHWTETTTPDGHTTYTSTDATAKVAVRWAKLDEQEHLDMKVGSTVETWLDSGGTRHVTVRRVL